MRPEARVRLPVGDQSGWKPLVPRASYLVPFFVLVAFVAPLIAQTTASLTGTVTSAGAPLPGVTITISSPSLQGTRSTVTGEAGAYDFASLPPGGYSVSFDLPGMQPAKKTTRLPLSE